MEDTLDSLVPLLHEVNSIILLTNYQGRNVITLMSYNKLVGQPENRIRGGMGPVMPGQKAWVSRLLP
jgi:hypothetical protein